MSEEKEEVIINSRARFRNAAWYNYLQKKEVLILGQGSIGSWVTLFLSRIGCNIYTFDIDIVDEVNLAGQLYGKAQIGKKKVDAIYEMINNLSDVSYFSGIPSFYDETSPTANIMIAAFDNMKSRKVSFDNWKEHVSSLKEEERKNCIFIDGRLSVEDYYVFAVRPGQEKSYEETLFSDEEGEELSCSLKSTSHCAAGIASDIVSILTNFAANLDFGEDIRDVPFSIHKSIQSYTYETRFSV